MNLTKTSALVLLLLVGPNTWSQEVESDTVPVTIDTRLYDKEIIKRAMRILIESRALTFDPAKGARFNRSLIEELRREGVIEPSAMKEGTICIDAGK